MIYGADVVSRAAAAGLDFYTGVPCSFLTPLMNAVTGDPRCAYVGATSEGEAIGIAAGAWLAGRGCVVMGQNSGLGNMVNPLTSLNHPFRIPALLLITWRGEPRLKDEPQHEVMGRVTGKLLDAIEIPHAGFPETMAALDGGLATAAATLRSTDLPYALVLRHGVIADAPLAPAHPVPPIAADMRRGADGADRPTRAAALEAILAALPDTAAVIATTGKTGRELFTLADRPQHLYLVGSMGCAGPVGLGVALHTDQPVVVLDGDGALLMKLGALATVGGVRPANLIHCLLDNGVHDSTGGQPTQAGHVDWVAMAAAAGYARAWRCTGPAETAEGLRAALAGGGPSFLHLPIRPGSMAKLGRPTIAPPDVARRFRDFLAPHRRPVPSGAS